MHTKGPWKANKEEDGQYDIDAWFDESVTVATVWNEPEAQANARLIAAAPNMLSFIDGLANAEYLGDKSLEYFIEEARKVFHEARGG